jgi:hypothetical protein
MDISIPTGALCFTQTIFENYPQGALTTRVLCDFDTFSENTIYRNVPITGTSTSTQSS